jgi:hypothetical protein
MAANKSSLNKSKTEYVIIGSHQNLKKWNSDFRIVIGNTPIKVFMKRLKFFSEIVLIL